jgi:hypothetical protein
MPGPKSEPIDFKTFSKTGRRVGPRIGKTALDKKTGKHARRLVNRHADPIRENGGHQFRR